MASFGAPLLLLAALLGPAQGGDVGASIAAGSGLRVGDYRVAVVSYRLAIGGRPFCSRRIPQAGFVLHHLGQYAARDRAVVIAAFALDRGPGVVAVVPGSPAAQAGLRAGDILLAVDGASLGQAASIAAERDEAVRRDRIAQIDAQLAAAFADGAARLRIAREGAEAELDLRAEPGCPIRPRLANAEGANAFSDGENVVITAPLLALAGNDDELAVVLAHELAHNVLGHAAALRDGRLSRRRLRALGLSSARELETQADRLAVRLVAAAGFDPRAGLAFWERLRRSQRGLRLFASHPGARQRARRWAEALDASPAPPE